MNYLLELRKDKINKNGLIPIRIVITSDKIKIRKNLSNVKTLLDDWDQTNGYIRNNKKNPFYKDYLESNNEIQLTKDKVKNIFSYFEYNNVPFSETVFLEKFGKDELKIGIDFFEAFEDFIIASKHKKTEGTINRYKTLRNFLIHFTEHTKYPIRFDTINQKFEEVFMNYAFEERKTLNNYYGKLISIIKTYMNWAFALGLHKNIDFKKLKRIEDEIEVIYLEKEELIALYEYNFDNDRLDKVRDFFCFGCFTGLRFSDIRNIDKANITDEFIQLNIIKTKTISHRIELNKYSKAILDKYRDSMYKPLPKISSQKLNKYIKECCEIVGIDEEVTITRYIGKIRTETSNKKYELITSHIARKTFVTNSLLFGMDERVLRETTKHLDEKSFKKYLKIPNSFLSKQMHKTWDENLDSSNKSELFAVITPANQVLGELKKLEYSGNESDYENLIIQIKRYINYKDIEQLIAEISKLKNKDVFNGFLEKEKYYWRPLINEEYNNEFEKAKNSLCTSDFLAYLVGKKVELRELKKHAFFKEIYSEVNEGLNLYFKLVQSILSLETGKKQHIPVNYAFSMFFLFDKKIALTKFKKILNDDKSHRLEALYQGEYLILFDKFFDRLNLEFIPKIDFSNNEHPIDFGNSENKYITKEEIQLIIDKEDYFNSRVFNVPSECLLSENNFNKKESFLKSILLYFEFNKIKKAEQIAKVIISCFTEPNPSYDRLEINNTRVALSKYLLDNSKLDEFIYFLYYLICNRTLLDSKTKLPVLLTHFLYHPKGMSKQKIIDIFSNRAQIENIFEKTLPKALVFQAEKII